LSNWDVIEIVSLISLHPPTFINYLGGRVARDHRYLGSVRDAFIYFSLSRKGHELKTSKTMRKE